MTNQLKRMFSWLGPYPYNPWLIFAFFSMMYFSRFVPAVGEQPAGEARWIAGATILAVAAVPGAIFALVALLCNRFRFWPLNRFTYILEISVGQALLLIFFPLLSQVLQSQLGLKYTAPVALTPLLFLGSLVLVLGIFAAMHHGEKVVLNRLKVADNLVSKLEVDRETLLRADEELRQQTARFLHDRVQSDLMVAGIKLKNVSSQSSGEVSEVIGTVISLLENTRAIDLKNLTQILAPNFEANGIEQALHELVEVYKAEMVISVTVDDLSERLGTRTQLGIFRITEQALLNALVHGPAKAVNVSLLTDSLGVSVLTISDDGPGASADQTQAGVGTAVIDSWAGALSAKKSIETVPGHGYQLTITIPRAN
jgi:signal transduction histidine kinase